jgi:tRNA pseudouridine55 synthase
MAGILIIDKPSGITSFDVIEKIRKITGIKKIGHTGTLDPLATGVLPLCIGEATKLSDFLMSGDKTYEVRAKLGGRTNTLDSDGTITATGTVDPKSINKEALLSTLPGFTGEISQIPPMYSAIKKDGTPLYELARKGQEVEREKRKITIHKIELMEFASPYIKLRVECSKGTYIRTLIDDIGEKIGTYAHVVELRRTRTSVF